MKSNLQTDQDSIITVNGKSYKSHVILADVNIPYKLSINRSKNHLFFCINADEFSNQSFHSVLLNLDTGLASIIPGIRNGFASTVDQASSDVYLGGSDGIFKFDYNTHDIEKPAVLKGIDIFDMYFNNDLYFVDTANQDLYLYKQNKKNIISEVKGYLIHHFVIDSNEDLIFVSPSGIFALLKGSRAPVLYENTYINIRGAATDVEGIPYFIAQDGIYSLDEESKHLVKILSVENGNGLAFDKDNNIVYSDERSVIKLIPYENF